MDATAGSKSYDYHVMHNLNSEQLANLKTHLDNDDSISFWEQLAEYGDSYADNAYQVVSGDQSIAESRIMSDLVENHWENATGSTDAYENHYGEVAFKHATNYLAALEEGDWPVDKGDQIKGTDLFKGE